MLGGENDASQSRQLMDKTKYNYTNWTALCEAQSLVEGCSCCGTFFAEVSSSEKNNDASADQEIKDIVILLTLWERFVNCSFLNRYHGAHQ